MLCIINSFTLFFKNSCLSYTTSKVEYFFKCIYIFSVSNKPKIIRTVIARFPTKNKAMAFHDVLKARQHLLPESMVKLAITAHIGEAKIMTIGIYNNEEEFKKGSIIFKEILETIKTMDGSYDILPGEIIEYNDEPAIQKIKDDNKK